MHCGIYYLAIDASNTNMQSLARHAGFACQRCERRLTVSYRVFRVLFLLPAWDIEPVSELSQWADGPRSAAHKPADRQEFHFRNYHFSRSLFSGQQPLAGLFLSDII